MLLLHQNGNFIKLKMNNRAGYAASKGGLLQLVAVYVFST